KLTVDRGASLEFRPFATPLQIAARFGHTQAVSLLILRGADVNARGGEYGTTLSAASTKNHYDIVRILLAHGADVQTRNKGLGTALSAASRKNHKAIYDLLIEHGAHYVETPILQTKPAP
ncbi:ankyrin repeat-containing domain protein, partial [Mycena vulgaris]